MTMEELQKELLKELNSIDFDYYKSEFGWDEWKTIYETELKTCHGWHKEKTGIEYNPSYVRLHCNNENKIIKSSELKRMFESQNRDKQLVLF